MEAGAYISSHNQTKTPSITGLVTHLPIHGALLPLLFSPVRPLEDPERTSGGEVHYNLSYKEIMGLGRAGMGSAGLVKCRIGFFTGFAFLLLRSKKK